MKVSYSWLKDYLDVNLNPSQVAGLLTDCGLEVEETETFHLVKGGLEGLVVGEVKSKTAHPNADKLSLTTVDIGSGDELHIVCGAPNVAEGQKVIVATVGAKLYPVTGDPFVIKKSKIRGEVSEGMICAEDEIGLGAGHDGIMVLDASAKPGMLVAEHFGIKEDAVFTIGLTPNRSDATSHIGVARDLVAVLKCHNISGHEGANLKKPSVEKFSVDNHERTISVTVEDAESCPRYSGLTISGIVVKESPSWLKNKLKSVGIKPINNIVDVTNFVMMECGQPLHAFDADKILGGKVIVKKLPAGTRFRTLDNVERELSAEDLMICNEQEGMCIAGVFGGITSGISSSTTSIFIESAYFTPKSIRRTSSRHGLKTDASFRYERGADPDITVYALKRAAILIGEVAGGSVSSEVVDMYPHPVEHCKVKFSYERCARLAGQQIETGIIKNIIQSLDIKITQDDPDGLNLLVPPFKTDVQREVDVIEEVMRIYGYDRIGMPKQLRTSLSFSSKPDRERMQNSIADHLSSNGFYEIMSNSITRSDHRVSLSSGDGLPPVPILNPLSKDLNCMRQTMVYSGLEAIVYNRNRKRSDLKLYEFGKTYHLDESVSLQGDVRKRYFEKQHLALFITGRKFPENWKLKEEAVDFYLIKAFVHQVLDRFGIGTELGSFTIPPQDLPFSTGEMLKDKEHAIVSYGAISRSLLKDLDLTQDVFYADFDWNYIIKLAGRSKMSYKETPKFPEVKRDLALLLDKSIRYEEIERIAYETERKLLKDVRLFDVYEGEKIGEGKKSYAISFILQDEETTLTDGQIDKVMGRLMEGFEKKTGAIIRK